jgi:hypothetical protein
MGQLSNITPTISAQIVEASVRDGSCEAIAYAVDGIAFGLPVLATVKDNALADMKLRHSCTPI